MWASLTQAFAKDLGEFASVLTKDTQRIVEGADSPSAIAAEATGGILAGDEASPEGTVFPISRNDLEWLQTDVATFSAPLSNDELDTANRLSMEGRDPEALLEQNQTIRDQYAYLVTQRAMTPAVTPVHVRRPSFEDDTGADKQQDPPLLASDGPTSPGPSVTATAALAQSPKTPKLESVVSHDEFFRRYFTRLLLLRRACSTGRRKHRDGESGRKQPPSGGEEVEGWDEHTPPRRAAAAQVAPAASGNRANALASEERAALEKRIADLERLVKALSTQMEHLQQENASLRVELGGQDHAPATATVHASPPPRNATQATAEQQPNSPPKQTAASPLPTATSGTRAVSQAIDDDDWATLT
jgi:pyruvate/2-oxoglutarate dehydrogenase complex dihydrolipoamide acyltransferase (E2) component